MRILSLVRPFIAGLAIGLAVPLTAAPAGTNPPVVFHPKLQTYVLTPNDVITVKVYQEDDLESRLRVARDGTITFPLIGVVEVGGKTVEQAANLIRQLLDQDYLVNPQITLTVAEYAKRRFTVLGQVQKPGAYEIPNEDTVNLLEAIAMAGGYTRLANSARITVTRSIGDQKMHLNIDGKAMTKSKSNHFEIQPDDTITVDERIF